MKYFFLTLLLVPLFAGAQSVKTDSLPLIIPGKGKKVTMEQLNTLINKGVDPVYSYNMPVIRPDLSQLIAIPNSLDKKTAWPYIPNAIPPKSADRK